MQPNSQQSRFGDELNFARITHAISPQLMKHNPLMKFQLKPVYMQ